MSWLIPLRFARVLLLEGEECPGSSPFALLGYFSQREKNLWLSPVSIYEDHLANTSRRHHSDTVPANRSGSSHVGK